MALTFAWVLSQKTCEGVESQGPFCTELSKLLDKDAPKNKEQNVWNVDAFITHEQFCNTNAQFCPNNKHNFNVLYMFTSSEFCCCSKVHCGNVILGCSRHYIYQACTCTTGHTHVHTSDPIRSQHNTVQAPSICFGGAKLSTCWPANTKRPPL